jgi:hypothetical protein
VLAGVTEAGPLIPSVTAWKNGFVAVFGAVVGETSNTPEPETFTVFVTVVGTVPTTETGCVAGKFSTHTAPEVPTTFVTVVDQGIVDCVTAVVDGKFSTHTAPETPTTFVTVVAIEPAIETG